MRIDVCIDHLRLSFDHQGSRNALIPFRKFYAGYLNGLPYVAHLRKDLMQLVDLDKIIDRLYQYLDETVNRERLTTLCAK